MEFTIKKVLKIDKEAEEYKKNIEKTLVDKRKNLDEYVRTIDREYGNETEKMKESIIQDSIREAEKISLKIKSDGQEETDRLNNAYEENRNIIADEIYEYVISSCMEG